MISWPLDGDRDRQQAADCYVGLLLELLAAGESKAIGRDISAMLAHHQNGQRDELVRLSPTGRVTALAVDEPRRLATVRITPMLAGELAEYEGAGPSGHHPA